jgi:pectate lyase
MKRSVLFGVFLALVVVAVAFAQGKPNFAGTWTLDQAKTEALNPAPAGGGGGGGRGMGGGPMTVAQTDKQLTIEQTMGQNTVKSVYNLDGTESKNESMGRGGTPTTLTSTVKWDGNKLLITTKSEGPSGPVERVQTWSLNPDGTLTIERPGRGGGAAMKTVYTKGK